MTSNQRTEKIDMSLIHKLSILVLTIALMFTFWRTKKEIVVVVQTPQFHVESPPEVELNNGEVEDIYNQLIDIDNFSFIMNPQPCKNYTNGLLLSIIVASKPTNSENRMLIRNTWGHVTDDMKVVFLLGETDDVDLKLKIDEESYEYGDIVKGNFIDSYRNMTYKHIMGLKWVTHHCPNAKYILKTDDDVFVNMKSFKRFLARELSPWGSRDLIACRVLEHAPAQRSSSKWIVSIEEYPSYEYPPYCAGWAVLYSQDVTQRLLKIAPTTPYFWIDDVQVTGVMAQKIGVKLSPLNKLILPYYKLSILYKLGPGYVQDFLFGPYDLTLNDIKKMWTAVI